MKFYLLIVVSQIDENQSTSRKENISIECYYVYNIQALYLSVF